MVLNNFFSNFRYNLSYISENARWAIYWEAQNITRNLNNQNLLRTRISYSSDLIFNQIVHFGSEYTLKSLPHRSNKVVLSWYHFVPQSPKNVFIERNIHKIHVIHTSANRTKKDLISFGLPESKIKVIPIGVDLSLFNKVADKEKIKLRDKLSIPKNRNVIGSFQKDGNGWGDGITPKMIKGPDILVKTLAQIRKDKDIFVLLVGPARGYVKRELEKKGIPYHHVYLDRYEDIADYYRVCDLCLVTSRVEGGPKQVLEAMACGIPVISTDVGLVPDIGTHNKDLMIAGNENIDQLALYSLSVLSDNSQAHRLRTSALETIKKYSWDNIAKQYYKTIYAPLLSSR